MRQLPNTVLGMIEELEHEYPARCKRHDESLEQHANYAGAVSLIENLRGRFEAAQRVEQHSLPKVL